MADSTQFLARLDASEHAAVFATELGWMACVWRDGQLSRTTFGHATAQAARQACQLEAAVADDKPPAALRQLVKRLTRYSREFDDDFRDVPLDTSELTPFQRRVVAACRRVPPGKTCTYGELAAGGGNAKAARAAGSVMAKNRFPLVVPCHRVVGSSGSLGGFSAPQGLTMKRRLLDAERAAADEA